MYFGSILCQTNDGIIELSPCKRFLKLAFNNILIINSVGEFEAFFTTILECYERTRNCKEMTRRNILFSTQTADLKLYFSPLEIKQLHYLIESAVLKTKDYV